METGNVVSWQKKEGDRLDEGDLLCEIETDKATMGFETPEEGFLAKIILPEGSKGIPVGKLLCIIVSNKEDVNAFANYVDDGSSHSDRSATPSPPQVQSAQGALPSHNQISLPALSPTMETGSVVSWLKKEGDQLEEGDVLCEIETDKATMSFETPEEGYLAKIIIPEGTKGIPVGKPLCVIVNSKDDVAAFANYVPVDTVASQPFTKAQTPSLSVAPPPLSIASSASISTPPSDVSPTPRTSSGRIIASPMARKLAADKGIDLATIVGTGPGGRIIGKDVENALSKGVPRAAEIAPSGPVSAGATFVDIPLSNMRMTIAKRLLESKSTIPHYYLTSEIRMDLLLETRSNLNELLAKSKKENDRQKLSVNDFVIKASALACKKVPETNSFFMGTFIRCNNNVDISVAVSTDSGLITPIIFNADGKGLATISSEVKVLAEKARQGKLQLHEFQGGTFTVSNLGMFGSINSFSAIINPPQSCILAVGGVERKVIPDGDEGYATVSSMRVTLSCDHRVVDGAVGAQWLKYFKDYLENPQSMLL
ncbi:unnamed protein product [Dracunculus medinensis]|uniref:Acetyltransferase component of pyruvate dehydrogenase complex n=1 Tax=Dracunculus medinensis TaxID=318479 RepID=A0A0N4U0I9_DRAME|nr:unnamed protein product [Dracunculus medinensis]